MRTNILFKSKGLVKVLPFYLFAFLLLTSCADLDYTEETTRDEEWTFTYFNEGIKGLVSGVKVFVQGQNLLSFDNIDAMDAENLGTGYPVMKSVNIGLNVTF